jgi:hypothetical protein
LSFQVEGVPTQIDDDAMVDAMNSHDDDHGFNGGLGDLDGDDDTNGINREG